MKFKQTLDVKKAWSVKLGGKTEYLRLGLAPTGDGTNVYAASHEGRVAAINPATGKIVWQVETGAELSAGPGVGEKLVVVASSNGDVIALNTADGSEVWHVNVRAETLAKPLVTRAGVAISTIDGILRMLTLNDGSQEWLVSQELPSLTLRGSSSPIVVGSTLLAGFDNGRLMAFDLDSGDAEWEAMISPPSGRSDLDRLSDLDGELTAVGQDVYASGYHGQIYALAAESGQVLWSRDFSTDTGVSADWTNVYLATAVGEIVAMLRRNGDDVWRSDSLLRREPTTPASFELTVAVTDFEGYVHFFSNIDGRPVARLRLGKGSTSPPVVIGDQLYVQSETGELAAYRIPKPEPTTNAANNSGGS